ncbi:hypothetical protein PAJ34TS1_30570 [Paenibacillus azoreducens]|uniref:Uncharacterized protein n=1 Tax=Paenibacillus azoreducens TaxID=116718 RepID=A0A919YC80_9BACL|nr:hypothetical protein J34TS1_18130 [Paenibacillus azoreducens]
MSLFATSEETALQRTLQALFLKELRHKYNRRIKAKARRFVIQTCKGTKVS